VIQFEINFVLTATHSEFSAPPLVPIGDDAR
jgi:hypothetical protein